MKRSDKVLIGLMILLLPLALLATYRLFPDPQEVEKQQEEMQERVESAITELTQTAAEKRKKEAKPIRLSEVSLATESATLKIMGTAPKTEAALLVSATVLPSGENEASAGGEQVKGSVVETFSVPTNNRGVFVFEYELEGHDKGIVEMRLEQGDSVNTVRFDLEKQQQLP